MENLERLLFIKSEVTRYSLEQKIEYMKTTFNERLTVAELSMMFENKVNTQVALSAINAYATNLIPPARLALSKAYLGWCALNNEEPAINLVYWSAALPTKDKLEITENFYLYFNSIKNKVNVSLQMMSRLEAHVSPKQFACFLDNCDITADIMSNNDDVKSLFNDAALIKRLSSICSSTPKICAGLYNLSTMFVEPYNVELKKAIRALSPEVGYQLLHVLRPERKQEASEFIKKHMPGHEIVKKFKWYAHDVIPTSKPNSDSWYIEYLIELTNCKALTLSELKEAFTFETTNLEAFTYSDANPLIRLCMETNNFDAMEALLKSIIQSTDMQKYAFKYNYAFKQIEEFAQYTLGSCSDSCKEQLTWILLLSCATKFNFTEKDNTARSTIESKKHIKDSAMARNLLKYELLTSLTSDSYSLNDVILRYIKEQAISPIISSELPTLG